MTDPTGVPPATFVNKFFIRATLEGLNISFGEEFNGTFHVRATVALSVLNADMLIDTIREVQDKILATRQARTP